MEPFSVIYSNRKTIAIYILPPGIVQVRAPFGYAENRINDFLIKKDDWIKAKLTLIKERCEKQRILYPYSPLQIKEYKNSLEVKLTQLVQEYSRLIKVSPTKVVVRNQKSKWGSCSSKGTLSFNWRLALVPEDVLSYIVMHELCHLVHMNHSYRFWDLVEKNCPDYKKYDAWLKNEGLYLLAY